MKQTTVKRTKSRTALGSTPLTVSLLVALAVALGFIYWQNFIHKPVTYTEIVPVGTSVTGPTAKQQARVLDLEKWNVSILLDEDSFYYVPGEYTSTGPDSEKYILSTKSLRLACGTDKATIGSVERVLNSADNTQKVDERHVGATKVVGDYLYIFSRPRTVCSDDLNVINLQERATTEFIDLLDKLKTN